MNIIDFEQKVIERREKVIEQLNTIRENYSQKVDHTLMEQREKLVETSFYLAYVGKQLQVYGKVHTLPDQIPYEEKDIVGSITDYMESDLTNVKVLPTAYLNEEQEEFFMGVQHNRFEKDHFSGDYLFQRWDNVSQEWVTEDA